MKLRNKVAIYAPSHNVIGSMDNAGEYIDYIAHYLCEWFGWCTKVRATGGWKSPNDRIVLDDITIIYAYCTHRQYRRYRKHVLHMGRMVRTHMKQDCVGVELNGTMWCI